MRNTIGPTIGARSGPGTVALFFLGDNRTGSYDARSWDDPYVPVSNVRSHVMVCISFLKDNSWRGIRAVS